MRVRWRLMTGAALLLVLLGSRSGGFVAVARAEGYDGWSSDASAETISIEGRLVALASSVRFEPGRASEAPAVSLMLETRDGRISVTLTAGVRVIGADGQPTEVTRLPLGVQVKVEGRWLSAMQFEASSVTVLP